MDSRCYNETGALLKILDEVGDEDAWCLGVDITVDEAEKLNFKFLKSCIATAQKKRTENAGPGSGRRLIPDDGLAAAREFEKGLDAEDEERKAAWEREEAARKAAEESAR